MVGWLGGLVLFIYIYAYIPNKNQRFNSTSKPRTWAYQVSLLVSNRFLQGQSCQGPKHSYKLLFGSGSLSSGSRPASEAFWNHGDAGQCPASKEAGRDREGEVKPASTAKLNSHPNLKLPYSN